MKLRVGLLALALSMSVGWSGCGAEDKADSKGQASAPERAALAWWDALRARDAERFVELLTPSAQRTLDRAKTRATVQGSLGRWSHSTGATVLYSERTPDGETVYMRIDGGGRIGPVLVRRGSLMLALPVAKSDGEWKIDSAAWARVQVKQYAAADLIRKAQKDDKGDSQP